MNTTLRRVTPVIITAAILASGCSVTARAAVGPAAPQASGAGFPASFIGVAPAATPSRLASYAASTGRAIKYLPSQQPGGGVSNPALSANGSTVAFERGQGSCARSIDTVPASGGAQQVLIPIRGTGNSAVIPGSPSYSSDGRYLIYDSVRCSV